jgi:hypothetical protein
MADSQPDKLDHPGAQRYAVLREQVLAQRKADLNDITQMAFVAMWKSASLAGVSNEKFENVIKDESNPLLTQIYNLIVSREVLQEIERTDVPLRDFAKVMDDKEMNESKLSVQNTFNLKPNAAHKIMGHVITVIDRQVASSHSRAG